MSGIRLFAATTMAMIAFAGNSLLCRVALKQTQIDAATFTSVRLLSGAIVLWIIVRLRQAPARVSGSTLSAISLFAYAICFSLAYVSLPAATGALLLFGAVQATMIGYGIANGERLQALSMLGVALACAGLITLVLPGVAAPSVSGSALMLAAGVAWGVYSIRGKRIAGDPIQITAGNFARSVPMTLVLSAIAIPWFRFDAMGVVYAIASGAVTSGIGYVIWYTALPGLQATQAAIVQLSVPVIAAIGGIIFLGETMTLRLVAAAIAIIGGIALVTFGRTRK